MLLPQENLSVQCARNSMRLLLGSTALVFSLVMPITPAFADGVPECGAGPTLNFTGDRGGCVNDSVLESLANSGNIIGTGNVDGVRNNSTINTLTNTGSIQSDFHFEIPAGYTSSIYNTPNGNIKNLNNSGDIGGLSMFGIQNYGSISTINNYEGGHIKSLGPDSSGKGIINFDNITNINNEYGAYIEGVENYNEIENFNNSGSINAYWTGIYNAPSGNIDAISNSGEISGGTAGIYNRGDIGLLSNNGDIIGIDYSDIYNGGTIRVQTQSVS